MEVSQIVEQYLKANGYDGLVSFAGECSCRIGDLMPCDYDCIANCEAGYKVPCTCGEGCEFHIATKKPKEEETNG
uniref:Uncharacterized protein n=1 Tax=viral metagenome TaxID=1070528 RepID=A0A6H1ZHK9_9ZZZZ